MNKQTRFQNSTISTILTVSALFGLPIASCKSSDFIGKADDARDAAVEHGSEGTLDLGGADGTPDVVFDLGPDNASDLSADLVPDLALAPDTTPDEGPGGDVSLGCQYPAESHIGSDGKSWWWWRFHWWNTSACSAWGADAKLIVEVDLPTNPGDSSGGLRACTLDDLWSDNGSPCAMANSWRFQATCTAGEILLDLPSSVTFHGYYHLESSTFPSSARHLISQDIHCPRDLYLPTGIVGP